MKNNQKKKIFWKIASNSALIQTGEKQCQHEWNHEKLATTIGSVVAVPNVKGRCIGGEEERRGEERSRPAMSKRNSPTCTHAMANWQIHVCLRTTCLQSASRRYKRLGTHAGKLQFSLGRLKYRDGKHEDQGRVSRKRYYRGNEFKRIAGRRKEKRKGEETRREEGRSERKWLSELSRFIFESVCEGKIGENCTKWWEPTSLNNIVVILGNLLIDIQTDEQVKRSVIQ